MRERGGDDERVEDLVVAEQGRAHGSGRRRVHDGADGVEHAAARHEQHALQAGAVPEAAEPDDPDPAQARYTAVT